jgi:hypothetical protein
MSRDRFLTRVLLGMVLSGVIAWLFWSYLAGGH